MAGCWLWFRSTRLTRDCTARKDGREDFKLVRLFNFCRPDRDVPIFLDWFEQGALDLDALVTRRDRLDQINEAVAALEKGEIDARAILEL